MFFVNKGNSELLNSKGSEIREVHSSTLVKPFLQNCPSISDVDPRQKCLDASRNQLTEFSVALFVAESQWRVLTHLNLNRNQLVQLPDELFRQLENLVWLDVRWNEFDRFPKSIKDHSSLKILLLQNNNLIKLPIEIGTIKTLQFLSVLNNPLEFPNKRILSKCRSSVSLIEYMRKCWQHQTENLFLPTVVHKGKQKCTIRNANVLQTRKIQDHTEMICQLRNSGKIKDQITADEMIQTLELREKIVQAFKDQEVLKKWRSNYKKALPSSRASTNKTRSSLWGPGGTLKTPKKSLFVPNSTRDLDEAIDQLQNQLSHIGMLGTPEVYADLEAKEREIQELRSIQQKMAYLNQRC